MILNVSDRHRLILSAIAKRKAYLAECLSYRPIPDPLKGKGHMPREIQRLEQEIADLEEEDKKLVLQYGPAVYGSPSAVILSAQESPSLTVGRNIDRLRKECGWSLNDCERRTGLDKKLIRGHISGKGARPKTLKLYAQAFSKELKRTVTVSELLES
jgi:hypothetical protein